MGPFPKSLEGFKYLLVVAVWFSNYTLLYLMKKATAKYIDTCLEHQVFLDYGVPKILHL